MITELVEFVSANPRLLVLTGAGCSAASGIPTYRDSNGQWQQNNPIQHGDFMRYPASRQRYWARSFAGWPAVAQARPNLAHQCLSRLEARGYTSLLVTQNVDRLHQRAGQRNVIDLHGRLDEVICMQCQDISARATIQQRLAQLNPQLVAAGQQHRLAPDGDAEIQDKLINQVEVPPCVHCGGLLKPNVVFFGDSVDRSVVSFIYEELENCDALLVIGSSLMVYSGFRFCRHAQQLGKPIACINPGKTRADELFSLKLETLCADTLDALCKALDQGGRQG